MIHGKKNYLANMLCNSGLLSCISMFSRNTLLVINYHRIKPDHPDFTSEFDIDVFGPTVSEFRQQIMWLKENANIISEADLLHEDKSKVFNSSLSILITFDDGYIDNYELAFPILNELKVPAIFFIPTKLISSRTLGWWDTISYFINNTKRSQIKFLDSTYRLPHDKELIKIELLNQLKSKPAVISHKFMNGLSTIFDATPPSIERQSRELMNWDHIREVSENNVTIGSHTHSHWVLSTLDLASQRHELQLSKSILEKQLNSPINSVAYPVGGANHYTHETCELSARCGYRLGFSFIANTNKSREIDYFNIARKSPPNNFSQFKAMISLPTIF